MKKFILFFRVPFFPTAFTNVPKFDRPSANIIYDLNIDRQNKVGRNAT